MDKVFLGSRVSNLDTGAPGARVSRVNLAVDSEHVYTAGDGSGRTVEAVCPWGTQAMADSILASLRDVEYRPYSGLDGLLDPAAEVGDGITVGGTYSVLAHTDILFDRHGTADVSAPGGDEIEDEYPYKSRARRQADRQLAQVYSRITKTAEQITLEVNNQVAGLNSRITLTASSLTTEINNVNSGLNSKIEQTASSLTTQINNVNSGLNSKIEQTASSLTTEINNTEAGLNSKIEQTASSLTSQINGQGSQISSISQSVNQIRLTVQGQGSAISSLEQSVNGFRLEVSNGSDSSTISLMSGWTEISSQEIVLRGAVTFEDLSGAGQSVINGANLTTGEINADSLRLSGEFTLMQGGVNRGWLGCGQGYDGNSNTYGPMLSGGNMNYLIVTNAGVRMQDGNGGAIWVTNGNCFSSVPMQDYSDRRLKGDIDYDLECYKTFFRALKPCRFLMLSNPGRGYHTGFVAQDVQAAMEAANLSQMDFAGLADTKMPDGTPGLTLSYGSFAALNTYMIQDLERRVAALERRTENE